MVKDLQFGHNLPYAKLGKFLATFVHVSLASLERSQLSGFADAPALTRFRRKRVGGGTHAPEKLRHNTLGSCVNANIKL